jgi:hypothetical protein
VLQILKSAAAGAADASKPPPPRSRASRTGKALIGCLDLVFFAVMAPFLAKRLTPKGN